MTVPVFESVACLDPQPVPGQQSVSLGCIARQEELVNLLEALELVRLPDANVDSSHQCHPQGTHLGRESSLDRPVGQVRNQLDHKVVLRNATVNPN